MNSSSCTHLGHEWHVLNPTDERQRFVWVCKECDLRVTDLATYYRDREEELTAR